MTAGSHLVHATCVALDGVGVLLRGASGAGKSDLALRLIDAGARLVADDQVALSQRADGPWAAPAPGLAGLLEVRGYGPVRCAHVPAVRVGLLVDLCPLALIERVPAAATDRLLGQTVRRAFVDPNQPSAPARVRLLAASDAPVLSLGGGA